MPIIKPFITHIDRAEMIRYAGLSRAQDWEPRLVETACNELLAVAQPLVTYRLVPHANGNIDGAFAYQGSGLAKHLGSCSQVVIVAATLGAAVDELLDSLFAQGRYALGVLVSAAATALIEQAADYAEGIILKTTLSGRGKTLGRRFSPGYGDWKLEQQQEFFPLLHAEEIGMSLTDSCSLVPKKSITAVIPVEIVGGTVRTSMHDCGKCSKLDCEYRK